MFVIPYFTTVLVAALMQMISAVRNRMAISAGIFLTIAIPFIGWPAYRYRKQEYRNSSIIFSTLAILNTIFWTAFFLFPRDVFMKLGKIYRPGNNQSNSDMAELYSDMFGTAADVLITGATNTILFLVYMVIALFTILVPLLIALVTKKD